MPGRTPADSQTPPPGSGAGAVARAESRRQLKACAARPYPAPALAARCTPLSPLPPSRQREAYSLERTAKLGTVVRLTGKRGIEYKSEAKHFLLSLSLEIGAPSYLCTPAPNTQQIPSKCFLNKRWNEKRMVKGPGEDLGTQQLPLNISDCIRKRN